MRIAHRTGAILEEQLDAIEKGEKEVSPTQAAVLFGISRDKLFRRTELKRPPAGLLPELLRAIADRAEEIRQERGVIAGEVRLLEEATGEGED